MTKRLFTFRLIGIGRIKILMRLLFTVFLSSCFLFAVLNFDYTLKAIDAQDYSAQDVLSFFCSQGLCISSDVNTLRYANVSHLSISLTDFLSAFPQYLVQRHLYTPDTCRDAAAYQNNYFLYQLEDDSRLFLCYSSQTDTVTHIFRIRKLCQPEEFKLITPSLHTMKDVTSIDYNAWHNEFVIWGPITEHCLSDNTYWQITYSFPHDESDSHVVKTVHQVDPAQMVTALKYLLIEDMP